ncbi:hypothetical protein ALC53_12189 [Atta colombica]|uniref:DNA-directed DNA polymerase n=1 Tax=Atta colombica TaxID=520822 RepID=A0A195AYT3_9HYME|nr:hypothetical protein ALC53_12189 [Atta colombica]
MGVGYELCWRVIETTFESRIRILTDAVINSKYIEPRQFLEDAIKIVLEHMHSVIQCISHDIFEGIVQYDVMLIINELVAKKVLIYEYINDKTFINFSSNSLYYNKIISEDAILLEQNFFFFSFKGIIYKKHSFVSYDIGTLGYYNLCQIEYMMETCYIQQRKFLENFEIFHFNKFTKKRLDNLSEIMKEKSTKIVEYVELLKEIKMKKQSLDNACFAFLIGSTSPRFLNISSTFSFEKQKEMTILPLWLTNLKRDKHVNLLYVQDQNNNTEYFVWIKHLSRLVNSQLSKKERKKYFYDQYNNKVISKSNYAHAVNVWQRFSIRTLGEYSDLYLKIDVLLLADVFKNFHNNCIASYGFDPLVIRWDGKPIYVGMCILDISNTIFVQISPRVYAFLSRLDSEKKLLLRKFYFAIVAFAPFPVPTYYMTPLFRENCKVMYDTSDYVVDNAYYIGFRANIYALRIDEKKDMKKAKRVKSNVIARSITFDDYMQCLNNEIEMKHKQSCIKSNLHEVYGTQYRKLF